MLGGYQTRLLLVKHLVAVKGVNGVSELEILGDGDLWFFNVGKPWNRKTKNHIKPTVGLV